MQIYASKSSMSHLGLLTVGMFHRQIWRLRKHIVSTYLLVVQPLILCMQSIQELQEQHKM